MKRLWSLQQRNPSTCCLRRRSRYGTRSWTIPRPRSRCRRSPSRPTSAGMKPRACVWLPWSPSASFPSHSCCSRLTCRPSSSAPSWRRCCVTTPSRATCRWPCPCWSYWATASVRRSTSSLRWKKTLTLTGSVGFFMWAVSEIAPYTLKYGTICGVRNHIGRSQVHSYSITQCTAKTSVHPMYTQQLEITHNVLCERCAELIPTSRQKMMHAAESSFKAVHGVIQHSYKFIINWLFSYLTWLYT